jgi:hypothetical protein
LQGEAIAIAEDLLREPYGYNKDCEDGYYGPYGGTYRHNEDYLVRGERIARGPAPERSNEEREREEQYGKEVGPGRLDEQAIHPGPGTPERAPGAIHPGPPWIPEKGSSRMRAQKMRSLLAIIACLIKYLGVSQ